MITNYFFNFAKTLSSLLFPLITFTYSSRILGVDGIGQVNFAKSIVSYFVLIAGLGMNYYGTREVAKLRDNRTQLSRFVRDMLLINGMTTGLAYSLLIVTMLTVSKLHGYETLLVICSLAIAMQGLGMEWLYQGMEEYCYIAMRSMAFQGVALILMFLFVRRAEDVVIYAAISVLASSGSYVLNFFHARRYVDFRCGGRLDIFHHIKSLLWLFALALSIELYTVLDSSMLGFLQGDNAVGKYTAAIKVNKLSNQLILVIGVVLIPRLSYYIGKKEQKKVEHLVVQAFNYVFMLSVPVAVGLFMLSDELVLLLSGSEFSSAGLTMRIMTPIVLTIPFSATVNQQTFVPMGKEKLILMSTSVGAVSNFLCNLLLIPRWAENGAAVGTVVAESAVAIVCFLNVKRYFDVSKIFCSYYQYWLAVLPIPLIAVLFRQFSIPSFLRICFVILLSCFAYFAALYLQKNVYCVRALDMLKKQKKHSDL